MTILIVTLDKIDLDHRKLTKYWRIFGSRPIAEGKISPQNALMLFFILVVVTGGLIITLPPPNCYWVLALMIYSYVMEAFYQIRKREQSFPFAQLIGRTDFSFFPVTGYLVNGQPDIIFVLYFLFFYPYAQAHLGVSDIIDYANDEVRGLKTIPMIYGLKGTGFWVLGFTLLHVLGAILFWFILGLVAKIGLAIGCLLLIVANIKIQKFPTPETALRVMPLFHITLFSYTVSIILSYFI